MPWRSTAPAFRRWPRLSSWDRPSPWSTRSRGFARASNCAAPTHLDQWLWRGVLMAGQVTLTEQEARALASLLDRASERLATYEEQTHQDRRLAEEIREAADDLVNRIGQGATTYPATGVRGAAPPP